MLRTALTALISLIICVPSGHAQNGDPPEIQAFAIDSDKTLSALSAEIVSHLEKHRRDDSARLAFGLNLFLRSGEALAQDLYRYGAGPQARNQWLMFAAMAQPVPIPLNTEPEQLSYHQSRRIIGRWIEMIALADGEFAKIKSADVQLRVKIGQVRFDVNSDGMAKPAEAAWFLFNTARPGQNITAGHAEAFELVLDRGDVDWLRAYCHVCMAIGNAILAYDAETLFNHTAHLFFANPETPYPFLTMENTGQQGTQFLDAVDLISIVHHLSFPVAEAKRLKDARLHLKQAIGFSRTMWNHYLAETDDDDEWIPNPTQTPPFAEMRTTREMIDAWRAALDEASLVLDGQKLIPFWRGDGTMGINLLRVFEDPTPFDLVRWVQGAAAAPYLRAGPRCDPEVFRTLATTFDGRVFAYSFWWN